MTTRTARLTPPGTGAIAVIAVRGPEAWHIVGPLFQPRTSPPQPTETDRFTLGRFGEDAADEVVLSVIRTEPVPWLELHCHGGAEVVRLCLDLLRQRGAEVCSWQELERLTDDNPLRSAARAALAEAPTLRTAAILLDQFHGAFERAVRDILAALDASLPDEAGPLLRELARYTSLGRHLTTPWRVVIAGAPNVGKSSLANALAGYQRSVVSPVPGTTRDVVSSVTAVGGWPVELTDTAGQRFGAEALEEQGIQRARDAASKADLCLWVLDRAAAPVWPEPEMPALRYVINKGDLTAAWDPSTAAGAMTVSARTGNGIAELADALAQWLVPEAPPAGAAVPFTPELCEQIEAAVRFYSSSEMGEVGRVLGEIIS